MVRSYLRSPKKHFISWYIYYLPLILISLFPATQGYGIDNPECIAPVKPGGGLDLACQLLSRSLYQSRLIDTPTKIRYMPGGIGALAYNYIAGGNRKAANTVVAFSTGSALNIAQKKFGKYDETAVRWLGALATDFGIIAVRKDSAWNTLDDLVTTLKKDPGAVVFGAGGSIGSQDWMKSALLLKEAGINPKRIRYVAYEGGGEAINALLNNHIQVFPGDLAESSQHIRSGKIKVLAVFSENRIVGGYNNIPTAKEQGYPVVWTIWRGFYLPPETSDDDYLWWENTLRRLAATKEFKKIRKELGFFPFTLIGKEFDDFVKNSVRELRSLAIEFELIK